MIMKIGIRTPSLKRELLHGHLRKDLSGIL